MAIHLVNENDVEMAKSGRGFTKWLHVSPGGSGPEMMIRHWGPDTDIPVHSHPYHEMFYVLEGEIEIGGTTYSAARASISKKARPTGRRARPRAARCCAMPRPASANSVEAYIDADGLKTFYVKAGNGFPVVLFHGAAPGASAQVNWQLNIEPLAAAGFTVYAYDQAGFGRTDNPADLSIEYRVTHAKAFDRCLETRSLSCRSATPSAVISPLAWRSKMLESASSSRRLAALWRRKVRRSPKPWGRNIPKSCASMFRAWKICAR